MSHEKTEARRAVKLPAGHRSQGIRGVVSLRADASLWYQARQRWVQIPPTPPHHLSHHLCPGAWWRAWHAVPT